MEQDNPKDLNGNISLKLQPSYSFSYSFSCFLILLCGVALNWCSGDFSD
jgi:hypothetical protein